MLRRLKRKKGSMYEIFKGGVIKLVGSIKEDLMEEMEGEKGCWEYSYHQRAGYSGSEIPRAWQVFRGSSVVGCTGGEGLQREKWVTKLGTSQI